MKIDKFGSANNMAPNETSSAMWNGAGLLPLADGWALSADRNQWMLCRKRGPKWQPVSFVGSNKGVLRRIMREDGVTCTPEADAAVNALSDEFLTWRHGCQRVQP